MKRSEFELLVTQALTDIPVEFQNLLENVDVVVDDVPSKDQIGGSFLGEEIPQALNVFFEKHRGIDISIGELKSILIFLFPK